MHIVNQLMRWALVSSPRPNRSIVLMFQILIKCLRLWCLIINMILNTFDNVPTLRNYLADFHDLKAIWKSSDARCALAWGCEKDHGTQILFWDISERLLDIYLLRLERHLNEIHWVPDMHCLGHWFYPRGPWGPQKSHWGPKPFWDLIYVSEHWLAGL